MSWFQGYKVNICYFFVVQYVHTVQIQGGGGGVEGGRELFLHDYHALLNLVKWRI